jgi:hypothetical protein
MDYVLPDGPRAERLKTIDASTDLSAELKLTRLICEEMAAAGSPVAAQVAGLVGRLAERQHQIEKEQRSLITAEQLRVLMNWTGALLWQILSERLPTGLTDGIIDEFQSRFVLEFAKFRSTGQLSALPAPTAIATISAPPVHVVAQTE